MRLATILALALAGCATVSNLDKRVSTGELAVTDCGARRTKETSLAVVTPVGVYGTEREWVRICVNVENRSNAPITLDRRELRLAANGLNLTPDDEGIQRQLTIAAHQTLTEVIVFFAATELQKGEDIAIHVPMHAGDAVIEPPAMRYRMLR
jgi:hypothetical protein